jgi:LCP family protein required for cell wall assembly
MLWRFLFAGLIVISFAAATTAVAGLLQINTFTQYFNVNPSIRNAEVTIADPGNPQTILVIGSDHRVGEPFKAANTDTMMLVRLDPNSSTINVISVPRDLKVTLPGSGGGYASKVNAAYSVGGPALLLKVLKHQVFPGLKVNHIVDVNFGGFVALVNAIGCVYTDVDHRYYNNTAITDYSSINLQPGYQKLCGNDALSFVRFRHTDNDLVRNARQQDFIRWAKAQYSAAQLVGNRNKLMKIFGEHAQTDHNLHTTDGLINLFNLVAFSAGHTIKQIKFPAILNTCDVSACYVTANRGALQNAFGQFMTPTHPRPGSGGGHKPRPQSPPGALTADVADGRSQVAALPHADMPVYYPRAIAEGSQYCTNSTCTIPDQGGHRHPAYRITLVMNPALGQYYGVQGTTWPNPPILNGTHQTKMIRGRQLQIYFNGHKPTLVAWRTSWGVYWISNTLTDDLSTSQLTGIAASLTRG